MDRPLGFNDKYVASSQLLIEAYRMSEKLRTPLIVAFSGGKDSQCVYHLAKRMNIPFVAKHMFTTWEQPELIRFIRQNYPDCIHERQPLTMWQLIDKHGFLPSRWIRYCCSYFKEMKEPGHVVMTGVRAAESVARAKRDPVEYAPVSRDKRFGLSFSEITDNAKVNTLVACVHGKDEILVHPIFDWRDEDVKYFLSEVCKVQLCPAYSMGYKRVGCILCPLAGYKERCMDAKNYPKYYEKLLRVISKLKLENRISPDYPQLTAEQILDWYMKGKPFREWYAENVQQLNLF